MTPEENRGGTEKIYILLIFKYTCSDKGRGGPVALEILRMHERMHRMHERMQIRL